MAWLVEVGKSTNPNATRHAYRAVGGREEALVQARAYMREGFTVWQICDDAGNLVMNREQIERYFSDQAGGATSVTGG